MEEAFSRTEQLLGPEAMARLKNSRVAVFGIGGVGGYAAEALARSGLGALELIDSDTVAPSNLNRQIIALRSTMAQPKVEAAKARFRDINPDMTVTARAVFFTSETAGDFDFTQYDYIIDAVDTVAAKLALAEAARDAGVPIISAMSAGNKLDPTAFRVADISKTTVCPLARVMRRELKKRGIYHLKVVYSQEPPLPSPPAPDGESRPTIGSISFVPSVMGLILAGEVIKDLAQIKKEQTT